MEINHIGMLLPKLIKYARCEMVWANAQTDQNSIFGCDQIKT